MYTIYGLKNPLTKSIFYVGVTCNKYLSNRLAQHVHEARRYIGKNSDKEEIIRTILEIGKRPEIFPIETGIDSVDEADLAESLTIMEYNEKYDLTNVKPGGYDFVPYSARTDINAGALTKEDYLSLSSNKD